MYRPCDLRRIVLTILAAGLATTFLTQPAQAQSEDSWRELLLGIVHEPWERAGTADPQILHGAVPEGFGESVYVPTDATVHGSLVQADGSVTVVGTVARTSDQLWEEYRREMIARGWRVPEDSAGLTRSMGDIALAWVFCGESLEATLVSVTEVDTATRVRIDRHPEFRSWHCVPGDELRSAARSSDDDSYDIAPPLSGERVLGACREHGYGAGFAAGTVPSDLRLAELREHYESQLRDRGWSLASEEPSLLSRWHRDGTFAVLVVAPVVEAPGCWLVSFQQTGPGAADPRRR